MTKFSWLDNPFDMSPRLLMAVALILLAVVSRLVPHPANFAPVAAVAIFGGSLLPRRWAVALPLVAMVASDLIIGLHPLIFFTWGSMAAIAWLSHRYLKDITATNVVLASLGASTLFYVVTNFGVWLQGEMYARNVSGLLLCYYRAIPFFRNTIAGDLVFSGLLFGGYALLYRWSRRRKPTPVPATV